MATRRRSGAPLFFSVSSAVSRLATGFSISGASINCEALQLRTARLRYFFYGTLMDRAVLAAVLGRAPAAPPRAAILHGYRRMFRHGASYPVLAPAAGEAVSGVVVEGLAGDAGAALPGPACPGHGVHADRPCSGFSGALVAR